MSEQTVLSNATLAEFGVTDESTLSPADLLHLKTYELVLSGKSVYGDPASHHAEQKLDEVAAHIAFSRRQGTLPPAPEPWSVDRVAKQKLAQSFPGGEPTAAIADHHQTFIRDKLATTSNFGDSQRAQHETLLVTDLDERPSRGALVWSGWQRDLGRVPTGTEIRNAMLEAAEPAINAMAQSSEDADRIRKHLRIDRSALELLAGKGRELVRYQASKKDLGL